MNFFIAVCLISCAFTQSNNLVTPKNWSISLGSIDGFSQNGSDSENARIYGETPYSSQGILWEAIPDATSNADGGWNKDFSIDHTKTYRSMVWIKRTGSQNGTTYFGCSPSNTLKLDGTSHTNPYFWVGDLPVLDRWYLIVSYVYGSGETKTSYSESAGVYDGLTGKKINTATCYKNKVGATIQRHRAYLYYCTDTSVRQYFYAPRFEEVNGEEPSIQSLLPNNSVARNDQSKNFTANDLTIGKYGSAAYGDSDPFNIYSNENSGNHDLLLFGNSSATLNLRVLDGSVKVGGSSTTKPNALIKNDGTGEFRKIRVTETPTADFVFEEDYELPSLEKTEQFIKKNRHLPEIPSAKDMKENGLDMSEFQIKLLQKIEELTLHMIELKKENKELRKELNVIKGVK